MRTEIGDSGFQPNLLPGEIRAISAEQAAACGVAAAMAGSGRESSGGCDREGGEGALAPLNSRACAHLQPITLVLPYPISANRYWRTFMPKGFKAPVTTVSPEAKAYKAQVCVIARLAQIRKPISGRVAVSYTLYPQRPQDWAKRAKKDPEGWDDTVQCIDLDNAQKVLLDALKGVVIDDDKWVRRIVANRAEPDGDARLVVTIEPILSLPAQVALL